MFELCHAFAKGAAYLLLSLVLCRGCTDVVALLCIKQAKEGGDSKVASAVAVHNELIRRGRKVIYNLFSGA